jgi:O-antigen ligase
VKGLIFTYVMTYGGGAVALMNPYVGLLIYCSFAIIKPDSMWAWAVPSGNYSRIIAICLIIGWVRQGLGDWSFGSAKWIVLFLIGFLLSATISTMAVSDYPVEWNYAENHFKIVLPFVVGMTIIQTVAQARLLAWVLMFSQAYVAYEQNLIWIFGDRWIVQLGFAGMDNNTVALCMVTGAGLAFFLGMTTESVLLRWLSFGSAGLMAHYPMFSNSRGGMLALIVVGVVSVVLMPKQPKHYVYLLLAVGVGLRMAGPPVWERFSTAFSSEEQRDESSQDRLLLWEDAWDMARRYPIFGVGPDNFGRVAPEYGWVRGKECHSLWVQAIAELGFIGGACLVLFYLMTIVRLIRSSQMLSTDPWEACLRRAVIASLIGFAVAAQFLSVDGVEIPYYTALVGAAVMKIASKAGVSSSRYVIEPCPQFT